MVDLSDAKTSETSLLKTQLDRANLKNHAVPTSSQQQTHAGRL